MTLVATDKDYDDAIILYPYDYLEQESYYMEKKNDKPIYAKFDELKKRHWYILRQYAIRG
ncbi:hypothetical protein [uncultured Dysgonomonas sp.]|uniref:hypothetical protein n=1 Tax=uncultured Dysgonomonas sp. TaxID=206096 RepID=UPI0028063F72|nr:hypothetical protein [uncultured Dysgonomonas sp.]